MTSSPRSILEATRHTLYKKAEIWWWASLGLVAVGVAAALVVSWNPPERNLWLAWLAMLSVCCPVLAAVVRHRSGHLAGRADVCRRAALYHDSIGESLPCDQRRLIALWPSHIQLHKETAGEAYFSSDAPTGHVRLAENLAESAFWTSDLARVVSIAGFVISGGLTFAMIAVATSAAYLPFDPRAFATAQSGISAIATVITVFLIGELALTSFAYLTLASNAQSVFHAASQLAADSNATIHQVLRVGEEYSIALAANLPLPDLVYAIRRSKLTAAYRSASRR